MKTTTLLSVMALFSMSALANDTKPAPSAPETPTPAAEPAKDAACPTKCSKAPCCKSDKGISCDEECWLNIDTITVEAANGDPIAQYTLAYLTEEGIDTPKDPEKAKEMYKKALPALTAAAEKGHPTACRALAHMYAHGKGVDKDINKSERYHHAAKKHHPKCKEKKDCCPAPSDNADKQMQEAVESTQMPLS